MQDQPVILSVDDDAVNQAVIEMLLEGSGYKVLQAMDGVEALEVLEKCETLPALALVDVMMPRMSGYELCRKMREIYPPHFPVIMISAKSGREDIIRGLECMCNDYVTKPFDKEELLARIETLIKLDRMRSQQEQDGCVSALQKLALPRFQPPNLQPFPAVAFRIITGKPGDSKTAFFEFLAKKFDVVTVPNRIGGVFTGILTGDWEESLLRFLIAVNDYCNDDSRPATCFVAFGDCRTSFFPSIVPSLVFHGPVMEELNALLVQWADQQNAQPLVVVSNLFPQSVLEIIKSQIPVSVLPVESKVRDQEIELLHTRLGDLVAAVPDLADWNDVRELEATVVDLHEKIREVEAQYVDQCKSVNEKLKWTLQIESLNELLFLEVKRREFDHSPFRS